MTIRVNAKIIAVCLIIHKSDCYKQQLESPNVDKGDKNFFFTGPGKARVDSNIIDNPLSLKF